jgi:hypothetical protein
MRRSTPAMPRLRIFERPSRMSSVVVWDGVSADDELRGWALFLLRHVGNGLTFVC